MAAEHAATALVVGAATGGLIALLPRVADVRSAGPGDEIAHDLHTGLAIGAALVIALAAVAAYVAHDPVPLAAAAVGVTVIVGGYEWTLRSDGLKI